MPPIPHITLLGFPITPLPKDELLSLVEQMLDEKKRTTHHIITLNPLMLMKARTRKGRFLRDAILSADMVIPDGIGIVWASRFLGRPFPERITGIDFMIDLIRCAVRKKRTICLLGAAQKVVHKAARRLKTTHPELRIVGQHNGYYPPEREGIIARGIRKAQPGMLFVAMGMDRQERFIYNYKDILEIPVCMGVGGSFDVIAGNVARAPYQMRQIGLEWLFRICNQPFKRLGNIITLLHFVILVLLSKRR